MHFLLKDAMKQPQPNNSICRSQPVRALAEPVSFPPLKPCGALREVMYLTAYLLELIRSKVRAALRRADLAIR